MQDEADNKDETEQDGEDLVANAEKDFFEALEAEKRRREREEARKTGGGGEAEEEEEENGEEKQDKGKVREQYGW